MRLLPLLLLATLAATTRAQESDPASFFPDDSSALTGIRNLTKIYDLEDDHPLKELGAHPAVKHIFSEFSDGASSFIDDELLTDIGFSKEDLARAFPSRLALGVRVDLAAKADIEAAEAKADPDDPDPTTAQFGFQSVAPDMAIIADCTLTVDQLADLFEGFIAHLNRKATKEAEEAVDVIPPSKYSLVREQADGLSLFRIEGDEDDGPAGNNTIATLVEGVLILAPSPKDSHKGLGDGFFADVVRRVASGGQEKDSLASTDGYLDAAEQLADTDFYFYAPLENLAQALETMISESYEQAEEDGNPVGMFATKDAILTTIGLGDFKAFILAGTIVPEGFELFNELQFNERRGIISKILRYDDGGLALPDFAPEGLTAVAVSSLDVGGMLNEILAAVKAISPMASGVLDMQIANLEKEGLSIRDGIIGSLGSGITSFSGYSDDVIPADRLPSHLFVINLSDPAGMDRALAGVRAFVAKLGTPEAENREFMGVTIYQMDELAQFLSGMVDVEPDATASYAISGNRLLVAVGESDFMEHGITSLKKKGADLDSDPAIREAWSRWGDKNLVEFAYEDIATLLKSIALSTAGSIEFAEELGTEIEPDIDAVKDAAEALPPVDDLHYYLAGKTYNTPEALTGWAILAKKPKP